MSSAGGSGMARSRVELFEQIRRDRRIEQLSIRELAERHRVHRRTVRQALARAVPPPRKAYPPRPRPAIDPYVEVIDSWLLADREVPRKQRHTARRVWQRLVAEHGAGWGGHGVAVCRASARSSSAWTGSRSRCRRPTRRARRPSRLRRVLRELAGVGVKVWMFVMRLSHSGRAFHVAFATQAQEAFLEGHVRAFEHFGAVPAPDPLRQPQTRGDPGAQGAGPGRSRSGSLRCAATTGSTRSSAGRVRTARTRRAGWRARSAGSAAAIWSRPERRFAGRAQRADRRW